MEILKSFVRDLKYADAGRGKPFTHRNVVPPTIDVLVVKRNLNFVVG